jgi:hypothetical protein
MFGDHAVQAAEVHKDTRDALLVADDIGHTIWRLAGSAVSL